MIGGHQLRQGHWSFPAAAVEKWAPGLVGSQAFFAPSAHRSGHSEQMLRGPEGLTLESLQEAIKMMKENSIPVSETGEYICRLGDWATEARTSLVDMYGEPLMKDHK